ncbi:MAG TPA: serine hydrolase [Cyclobacteriaceae bacterium]|jgi:CubicO group peptidase (beta-lactamase class C family)|nr:serine hydrolase [Cyclobacteriaceae bacterium]
MKINLIIFLAFIFCGNTVGDIARTSTNFPNQEWFQYRTPEDAGWSSLKLKKARAMAEKVGSSNVLIIYKGVVLQSWGDASRRFCLHSARKSTLLALYGIYSSKNSIDLSSTLEELGIDEVTPLTTKEKKATIKHLITCYSGIYLPSVSDGGSLPERGSHLPGTHWYYNNWNFNTLNTIFTLKTKKELTDAFINDIALPIQMEDFRKEDAFYINEKISLHPAYHMNMSSRDLARFGLLYMNQGNWKGHQIVPEKWVSESFVPYSPKEEKIGFGYAWWIHSELKMYAAEGWGGHALMIFPGQDLIIVHRADTFVPKTVDWEEIKKIVKLILSAQNETKESVDPSTLIPFKVLANKQPAMSSPDSITTMKFEKYYNNDGDPMTIKRSSGRLILNIPYQGNFDLYSINDSTFYVLEKENIIHFEYDARHEPIKIIFD